jgi:acetylornithine/N-succinyldiaminopimelate aminotransferase
MKEIISQPPAVVHNETAEVQALFQQHVVPSYGRFDLVLDHGSGSYVWDVTGRRYLDLGGGVAVLALGHAPQAITDAMIEQSRKLIHISNFYYHGPQGCLARALTGLIGPGKCFFCNSGVEANEGLFKLARKFGHDEGRFEVITAINSFHGRTLGAIAATGQEKIKKGFEPIIPGFCHVPYNDLAAMREAITPATAAILVEGIQGEGGVTPATPEYLLGLRQLCDEKKLLLMYDAVQCGHFRTGRFQSYQRILEGVPGGDKFIPDAIAMAKSLGGGFPMGAFWVRQPYADLFGPGTHGSTFGGTPLGCAIALKILSVIETEKLADNVRELGAHLMAGLRDLSQKHPQVIINVRGLGFMIGIELAPDIPAFAGEGKSAAVRFTNLLHAAGMLAIPTATHTIRLLPPLNLRRAEADEGLRIIKGVVEKLSP